MAPVKKGIKPGPGLWNPPKFNGIDPMQSKAPRRSQMNPLTWFGLVMNLEGEKLLNFCSLHLRVDSRRKRIPM